MGSIFPELNERLQEFIAQQKMFFVASAPLAANGHINVSPKGLDCLRILGPTTIAYVDFTGSGIETVAHLRKKTGRLTLMFCAFQGPPRILRLRGRGEAIEPNDAEWDHYFRQMPQHAKREIDVHRAASIEMIADSCGYGIPLYEYMSASGPSSLPGATEKGQRALRSTRRRRIASASTACLASSTSPTHNRPVASTHLSAGVRREASKSTVGYPARTRQSVLSSAGTRAPE